MARIDLATSPTATRPDRRTADYALKPSSITLAARRRLRAARALGLRQDHAAQHHLRPAEADARAGAVRRPRRHRRCRPQQRNIAQVFQFPVIYDTMTVYENLAFPLATAACPRRDRRARVSEVAELLELDAVLDRGPRGLTADAKQKISLGRGLVRAGRGGDPVRRAADRDRPAAEVAAAHQAEGRSTARSSTR